MDEFEGDLAGLTSWREVREAEDQLRAAVEKRRRLDDPDNWSATESVDKVGRKQLNFRNVHFELTEHADQQVQRARAGCWLSAARGLALTAGGSDHAAHRELPLARLRGPRA